MANYSMRRFTVNRLYLVVLVGHLATPLMAGDCETRTLVEADNVGSFVTTGFSSTGRLYISHHNRTKKQLNIGVCSNSQCSDFVNSTISVDSPGFFGTHSSMTIDRNGMPVIAFHDYLNGTLNLLRCNDDSCMDYTVETPDRSGNAGQYSSIVLNQQDLPVISYYDTSAETLKLLHCDDRYCSGDEKDNITTPDSTTGDVGLYTSMVLDDQDRPIVSYYASNAGLKLLNCDDKACAGDESKNISLLDKGSVGWFNSMSKNAKGNPVIAYFDFSNELLKILNCHDLQCEDNSITIPDDVKGVGRYASMVVGAGGNPLVSYTDSSSGGIRILSCDDPDCSGDEQSNIAHPETNTDSISFTSVAENTDALNIFYYENHGEDLKQLYCPK